MGGLVDMVLRALKGGLEADRPDEKWKILDTVYEVVEGVNPVGDT
jgi:hypothetical protein